MLTSLQVRNFKSLKDVEIDLGQSVLFVGPNNSGKTTALQALALWEIGLRKWLEKRGAKDTPERRSGEYLVHFVQAEIEKWSKPIRQSGAIPTE